MSSCQWYYCMCSSKWFPCSRIFLPVDYAMSPMGSNHPSHVPLVSEPGSSTSAITIIAAVIRPSVNINYTSKPRNLIIWQCTLLPLNIPQFYNCNQVWSSPTNPTTREGGQNRIRPALLIQRQSACPWCWAWYVISSSSFFKEMNKERLSWLVSYRRWHILRTAISGPSIVDETLPSDTTAPLTAIQVIQTVVQAGLFKSWLGDQTALKTTFTWLFSHRINHCQSPV